jgi:mycothiol synthase
MLTNNILPSGFTVRATSMDDLKDVYAIISACDIVRYGAVEPDYSIDDLRSDWQDPNHDMDTDNWVIVSAEGRIVGATGIWQREHVRMYTHPSVLPAYWGLGIGRFLLRLAEERARQYIAQAPPRARITLNSGIDNVDQLRQQELVMEGFKLVRSSWRMEIDMLEPPPAPQWPREITIRTFVRGQDEHAVFAAVDEAFIDHWGHLPGNFEGWKRRTVDAADFKSDLWYLAYAGNEIAGVSLCEYMTTEMGWVDDLAVRRSWRRMGLGMALLRHSFGEFYHRGAHKVALEVDSQNLTGAARLYERAGMHATRQYDIYEKELRTGEELSTQSLNI